MRVEPYGVDSILHITKRGTRGMDIVRDTADRERFLRSLFYLNDTFLDENWRKTVAHLNLFVWPDAWPEREPLVHILAWTLMPNHFHLLVQEIREGGMSKFMQRLCGSMSAYSNKKYGEQGSIFQGSYKAKTISEDDHLRYLAFYIQVKNVLELYSGGLKNAVHNFDEAWEWALQYRYSSLPEFMQKTQSPIIGSMLLAELHGGMQECKKEFHELLAAHLQHHDQDEGLGALMLEPW